MISQEEFLEILIKKLNRHGIPYMISGSVSSSIYGQPRATKDIDIVIAPTKKKLLSFAESLGDNYYVGLESVKNAFAHNSMFNVIDTQYGWKVDFIIRKNRPFSRLEFERKCSAKVKDLHIWVTSPEDILLSKLEWAKNNQSEQQLRDALGVAVVQRHRLDMNYLRKWAKELQVESSLEQILEQAEKLLASE